MIVRVSPGSPIQWYATWSPRPALDVPVDAVVGDVELAADEPFRERQVPLEGRVERLRPVDSRSRASVAQNASSPLGLVVQRRPSRWPARRTPGRAGRSASSAKRFSISGPRGPGLDGHGGPPMSSLGRAMLRGRAAPASLGLARCSAVSRCRRTGRPGSVRSRPWRPPGANGSTRLARQDTRCGRGISMPCVANAASRRLRSSPPAAHCSVARTVPRILSVTPYSPSASTRSTCGASRIRRFQSGRPPSPGRRRRRPGSPCRCRCRRPR